MTTCAIAILDELTTGLDPQARRDTWELTGTGDLVAAVVRALEAAGLQARDMQVESATLDDAYVRLTHRREEAPRP